MGKNQLTRRMSFVALCCLLVSVLAPVLPVAAVQSSVQFYLPWPAGERMEVSAGNCESTDPGAHCDQYNYYAWDFINPTSSSKQLVASAPGIVCFVQTNIPDDRIFNQPHGGNSVIIAHEDSSCEQDSEGLYTGYHHLAYQSVPVSVGQHINAGDAIGAMGQTGYAFGSHLHFSAYSRYYLYDDTAAGLSTAITFADPSVAATQGIPAPGTTYTSSNTSWYSVEPTDGLTVQLVATHSSKCLDVAGGVGATGDYANVQQYGCQGPDQRNQTWRLKAVNGGYNLIAVHSGKCLDVAGGIDATGDYANVQQYTCRDAAQTNQIWRFSRVGHGYNIVAVHSDKCLDVAGGIDATGDYANVQQYTCRDAAQANQIWVLHRIIVPPTNNCLVPFLRYWSPIYQRHQYEVDWNILQGGNALWRFEGIEGYFAQDVNCFAVPMVPMHRFLLSDRGNKIFYTADQDESNRLVQQGYIYQVAGYVLSDSSPCSVNTMPLHRLYHEARDDHFWTINLAEAEAAQHNNNYMSEGIAAKLLADGFTGCDTSNAVYPLELYTESNFEGELCYVISGLSLTTNIPENCNERVSSIRLRNGWSVRVASSKNLQGDRRCITHSIADLSQETFGSTANVSLNDSISSFAFYAHANCEPILATPNQPAIKPRTSWNARDAKTGSIIQTPTRFVIHHTDNTIDGFGFSKALMGVTGKIYSDWKNHILPFWIDMDWEKFQVELLDPSFSSMVNTWEGLIWLIQAQHMYVDGYSDIAYHYLIAPDGTIYEGRQYGPSVVGQSVANANTGIIGIAFLGDFHAGTDETASAPTEEALKSAKQLTQWIANDYDIDLQGFYTLPEEVGGNPSCKIAHNTNSAPTLGCMISNVAGHKDYWRFVGGVETDCPGNLAGILPFLRGVGSMPQSTNYAGAAPINSGLLIGLFSPAVTGIVDPQGRRLGIDPATQQFVKTIPGGVFEHDSAINDEDSPHDDPFWLYVPEPMSGIYTLDVLGTGNGAYGLGFMDIETRTTKFLTGTTSVNEQDAFQVIYDSEQAGSFEVWSDGTPPVTTLTASGTKGQQGWFISNVTVTLTATDLPDPGASGIARVEYSFDHGVTWQTYLHPFALTNGTHTILYRSIDRVNNRESVQTRVVKVDTLAPTTHIRLDATLGRNNWYTSTVQITFEAQDNPDGSGVSSIEWSDDQHTWIPYTGPFAYEKEGIIHLTTRVRDVAGNQESPAADVTFKVDRQPPAVVIHADKLQYTRVDLITITFSGSDPSPGSGLASLVGTFNGAPISSGVPIDPFWFPLGPYNASATAVDNAGWSTTETTSVELIATLSSLRSTILRLRELGEIDRDGIRQSLLAKVDAAVASHGRGNLTAARNQLGSLISELQAQRGKHITVRAADLLIGDTRYVRDQLQ
jgi:hypothetical protein